jgi:NADH-quinone oxidoreductase subunit K
MIAAAYPDHALVLAAVLFALGLFGVLVRRNIVFILLSIEIMLNAKWSAADGQVMFIFILAMAAAEVSVGLALALQMHHKLKTLDTDSANRMRG